MHRVDAKGRRVRDPLLDAYLQVVVVGEVVENCVQVAGWLEAKARPRPFKAGAKPVSEAVTYRARRSAEERTVIRFEES